jgi:hypothetical protein
MRAASSFRQAAASSAGADGPAKAAWSPSLAPVAKPIRSTLSDAESVDQELSVEKEESQKLHARTLDASTAPHCKHVFVTGVFALRTLPLR